jgi:hypothetical protein
MRSLVLPSRINSHGVRFRKALFGLSIHVAIWSRTKFRARLVSLWRRRPSAHGRSSSLVSDSLDDHAQTVDDLIEDEGPVHMAANDQTFLVTRTRLLEVHIDIPHRIRHAKSLMLRPAGVGVRDQHVSCFENLPDIGDSLDVRVGVAADLQLELRVPL